ncbi:hypothetical protein HPP92_019428 [Vanilla planifolia]|uniref:Uncharacterized protein n=1 Tax=Vanilla planifolia TaxID=51239 RepID=A0A835UHJ9_VANPL|nr:hypothetical protein HPP92_019428 [Vanilla planifolia]
MLSADIFQHSKPPHINFSYRRRRLHCRALLPDRCSLPIRPLRQPCILRSTTATYSWIRKSSFSRKDCHGTTLEIVVDEFVETEVSDLPVELSLTRSLDPALTLGHAVNAMKDTIKKLKLNPPCSRSGVLRFQVLVPPSIKSLNWLYSQNKLSSIFPQFYILSRQDLEQSHVPAIMTEIHGVSGIGSAIVFRGSSAVLRGYHLMKRLKLLVNQCFSLI